MFLPLTVCLSVLPLTVCLSVCFCPLDYSKSYKWILLNFFRVWSVAQGTIVDFGGIPDPRFLLSGDDPNPGIFKGFFIC